MPQTMLPLSAVIFDFDGTLAETNGIKTDAFRAVFAPYGPAGDTAFAYHLQRPWVSRYDKIAYLMAALGAPHDETLRRTVAAAFAEAVRERVVQAPLVPGAIELLRDLTGRMPLYLISATPEDELVAILDARDLTRYFARCYGCPPWTKATATRDLLDRNRLDPARVAFVGDAPGDADVAQSEGLRFVWRQSDIAFPGAPLEVHRDMTTVGHALR